MRCSRCGGSGLYVGTNVSVVCSSCPAGKKIMEFSARLKSTADALELSGRHPSESALHGDVSTMQPVPQPVPGSEAWGHDG